MSFLKKIGATLFGSAPKIKSKQMYSEEDFEGWLQTIMGGADSYLQKLMGDYFGSTSATMGGAFGGQQGNFAAQGVASQLPQFMGQAGQLTQGQNQLYEKPGQAGLFQTAVAGLAGGAGVGLGAKLFGKAGAGPTANEIMHS